MKYYDKEGCVVYEGNTIIDIPAKVIWEKDKDEEGREDCYVVFQVFPDDVKIWVGAVYNNSYGPYSDSVGLFDYDDAAELEETDIINYAVSLLAKKVSVLQSKITRRNKTIKRLRAALKKK